MAIRRLPWWFSFPFGLGTGGASMFLPTFLTPMQQQIGLLISFALIACGAFAAGWHFGLDSWLSRHVWWRFRFRQPKVIPSSSEGAHGNCEQEQSLDEAFSELTQDRVPFVRIRDIAPEFGIDLTPGNLLAPNRAYEIEGALRQAAVDGKLMVWGRKYRGEVKDNDPLVPIPASHFEDYGFRHGNLHYREQNIHTATATMQMLVNRLKGIENVTFYDLYLRYSDLRRVMEQLSTQQEKFWNDIGTAPNSGELSL